jgi:uncharacterized membrane protein YeaQ/YmgE (transglycosylase-associated protein family)
MSTKTLIWWFLFIGSLVGGYIPTWFGASVFSLSALFWSTVGSFIGIWVGYKIGKKVNGGI